MTTRALKTVLVVDDSAMVRNHVVKLAHDLPNIQEIIIAENGQEAVDACDTRTIDIVILDIEMPVKDGITALGEIKRKHPHIVVIMASTLSVKNADITLRALALGAYDYVAKPSPALSGYTLQDFDRDLFAKLKHLLQPESVMMEQLSVGSAAIHTHPEADQHPEKWFLTRPRLMVIGSSTGGPNALLKIFEHLPSPLRRPIVIVQHMPPTFTTMLAENIQRASGVKTIEVQETQRLENCIYLAPGGFHIALEGAGLDVSLKVLSTPARNFCKPSVDPLFESAAAVFGSNVLAFMLTGMGSDGLEGSKAIHKVGGKILIQDSESSAVWGMPKAVYSAGIADGIFSLNDIRTIMHKVCSA